ncbi:UNVERIFIED_CONTAM: hypothetical protein K2H54_047746 [Gekko kuhli]
MAEVLFHWQEEVDNGQSGLLDSKKDPEKLISKNSAFSPEHTTLRVRERQLPTCSPSPPRLSSDSEAFLKQKQHQTLVNRPAASPPARTQQLDSRVCLEVRNPVVGGHGGGP